jgi:hypothetical protein
MFPTLIRPLAAAAMTLLVFAAGCQQQTRFPDGSGEAALGAPIYPHAHHDSHAGHGHAPIDPPLPEPMAQPPAIDLPSAELPRVPRSWNPRVRSRPWQFIVVHHSATDGGGAHRFDTMHRGKGWDELGYHFVIGNGSDTPDGAVEVGPRWSKQKHGAHAKTADNRFNELGIGICLVGNFDQQAPTKRQLHALTILTAHLMREYRIPPHRIIGHGDTSATRCPGQYLDARLSSLRRAANSLARPSSVAAVK